MKMTVLCLRFPFFAAAIERRHDGALQERPLVIGGRHWQAGNVYSMSNEAAGQGVALDVALRRAHLLCPEAAFLPSALPRYDGTAHEIVHCLLPFADRTEPQSTRPAMSVYMAGETRRAVAWAQNIGRAVRHETGLEPSIGIAAHKFAAYVAAKRVAIGRILPILPTETVPFLATISLHELTIPTPLRDRCALLGIRTLGDFAQLPADAIRQQFGARGETLFRLARGEDARAVARFSAETKQHWSRTFDEPIANRQILENTLRMAARQLAAQLRADEWHVRKLQLRVTLETDIVQPNQTTLSQPIQAERRLAQQLLTLLAQVDLAERVSEIDVTLSGIAPIVRRQLSLFETPMQTQAQSTVLGHLHERYRQPFRRVTARRLASRLPERRFALEAHDPLLA